MKLVEPRVVVDVLVSGVAAVELLKGNLIRFVHYIEQRDENGEVVGVINSRVVMPLESVVQATHISDDVIAAHQFKGLRSAH